MESLLPPVLLHDEWAQLLEQMRRVRRSFEGQTDDDRKVLTGLPERLASTLSNSLDGDGLLAQLEQLEQQLEARDQVEIVLPIEPSRALVDRMKERFHALQKDVVLTITTRKNILGGVIVFAFGKVFDQSLRASLLSDE